VLVACLAVVVLVQVVVVMVVVRVVMMAIFNEFVFLCVWRTDG
jgi:hypothetical protein